MHVLYTPIMGMPMCDIYQMNHVLFYTGPGYYGQFLIFFTCYHYVNFYLGLIEKGVALLEIWATYYDIIPLLQYYSIIGLYI